MRRSWSLSISLALVIANIQGASAKEPIKLGVVGPHSGLALGGQSTLIGAQVAAQEINAAADCLAAARLRSWPPTPVVFPPSRSALTEG
jgi:hypothetical protein